jgi:hypothetical protein
MLPLRPGTTPLKFAPDYESWLVEAMRHGDNDSFWTDMGSSVIDHVAEYKDVPVYHVTGWYDSWGTPVANINFVELRKAKKIAIEEMTEQARQLGANAVIAVDLDYETIGNGGSNMLMVSASGTAVVCEQLP